MRPLQVMQVAKCFAVIGATKDQSKYGYKIYKKLKEKGYTVYGINPNYNEIDKDKIYKSLEELPEKPDVAVFVVNPNTGLQYVDACKHQDIKTIWLQPGTQNEKLTMKVKSYDIEIIDACILVVANYL